MSQFKPYLAVLKFAIFEYHFARLCLLDKVDDRLVGKTLDVFINESVKGLKPYKLYIIAQ